MANKFNYSKLQETSKKLIDYFGFSLTEGIIVSTSTESSNFFEPVSRQVSYPISLVVLPLNSGEKNTMIAQGNTNIESYYKIIIAPSDHDIEIGYIVKADGISYRILSVTKLKPYDTTMLFKCIGEITK